MDWTAYLDTSGLPATSYQWQGQQVTRGYTGHEQLDPVGLVHMNGRVYDPEIGRFLSADAVIQDVTNLQSLNAYSYVLNNPLSFTDPSGFFFKSLFRAIGGALRSIFRAIGAVFKAVLKSSIGRAIIQIAGYAATGVVGCAAIAGGLVLEAGGSIVDALKAAAFSFIQVGVWSGVHVLGDIIGTTGTLLHSALHGVVSGALSVAQGGSFLQGFATGAIGNAGGLLSQSAFGAAGTGGDAGVFLRTAAAAAAGGLGAEVTGGKFANGAVAAAFAQLYNDEGGARELKRGFLYAAELFDRYLAGTGDLALSRNRFEDILSFGRPTTTGSFLLKINNETYRGVHYDFTATPYSYSIGRATVYFDQQYRAVGFSDTYDFDYRTDRGLFAEFITFIGRSLQGRPYQIYYGIHERLRR